MNTLALMRTHNSEKFIHETLFSLSACVDGIVIHDDNSTDDTVNICKSYAKVLEVIEDDKGFYHEGIDKSILLNVGKKYCPNNFLVMDDDEVIPRETAKFINDLTKKPLENMYSFSLIYLWGDEYTVRVDRPWCKQNRTKLFPNTPEARFYYRKCHCAPITTLPIVSIILPIWHLGYASKEKILDKLVMYREFGEEVNQMSNKQLEDSWRKPTLMHINEVKDLFNKGVWDRL